MKVNLADPSLEGDFFLDPLPAPTIHVGAKLLEFEPVGPNGLMLLNPEGKLLWWHQLPKGLVGSNLEKVSYEGKPAIAWWQGPVTETAYGLGEGVIANSAYEPIAHVKAGNGAAGRHPRAPDHPAGPGLDRRLRAGVPADLRRSHLPMLDATCAGDRHPHRPRDVGMARAGPRRRDRKRKSCPPNGVLDPYHLNSIQPLPGHRVLISMRDTSGVYLLDQHDRRDHLADRRQEKLVHEGQDTRFHFQHDARLEGKKLER